MGDGYRKHWNSYGEKSSYGETSTAADAGVATSRSYTSWYVFISHQGKDGQDVTAFVTNLYNDLKNYGFRPFLRPKPCSHSDNSYTTLEGACVHVVIFSKFYANSKLCLDELCWMLKSERPIIPVFYDVKRNDLRRIEDGPYKEAFLEYLQYAKTKKYLMWKEALRKVADYRGFEMDKVNG